MESWYILVGLMVFTPTRCRLYTSGLPFRSAQSNSSLNLAQIRPTSPCGSCFTVVTQHIPHFNEASHRFARSTTQARAHHDFAYFCYNPLEDRLVLERDPAFVLQSSFTLVPYHRLLARIMKRDIDRGPWSQM